MTPATGERPRILLCFGDDREWSPSESYRLSGVEVWSSRRLGELLPFSAPASAVAPIRLEEPSWISDPRQLPLVYEGPGWVGGREVLVAARAAQDRHCVALEDASVISVFERSGDIVVWVTDGRDPEAGRFGALGPGLALALALGNCFSLHASAVSIAGRTILLMGESGSGKSTMARLAFGRRGCRRIADDVVPVRTSAKGELRLAPRFPQLKLDRGEQWDGADVMHCRDLVAIKRQPEIELPQFRTCSMRDGALALLENTVASRLFSKELRGRELDAWGAVAGGNRVVEWHVPDDPRRISESFESLESLPAEP